MIPKNKENQTKIITDGTYRQYLASIKQPLPQAMAMAAAAASRNKFFHWFLEFPEVFTAGGFDCILGNPPYLGVTYLSGTYGYSFCEYVKWAYAPAGLSDLVVYFVRRIFDLLRPCGFTAFITTNSIKDGDNRKDGLDQVLAQGGEINFAVRGIKWPGRANLVISLVSIHKGKWKGKCILGGKEVSVISSYFEDSMDEGDPLVLKENIDKVYEGSHLIGDGFLLSHEEAKAMILADPRNREVIFPVINGQELNNNPEQDPGRSIINFFDWDVEKARRYEMPFMVVEQKVKPERMRQNDSGGREYWWRFLRPRKEMYTAISILKRCFITATTTKYLNFSAAPTQYVFTKALKVFTTDRWDLYAVVQSTLHEVWARKYSGSLETRLAYSPSNCFETFPFPKGLWQTANPVLAILGEHYHEHRRTLMRQLWIGLTDLNNLFHAGDLTPALVQKVSKRPDEAEAGCQGVFELRRLHRELDEAVRDAFGWSDLDLGYNFHEVETLPDNDRVRFTISPSARREVLKRLLKLNHAIHEQEVRAGLWDKKKIKASKITKPEEPLQSLLPDIDVDVLAATSYPATARDEMICAAALSIIEQSGGLTSVDHLDALLLATHPEWCKSFLEQNDVSGFHKSVASTSSDLFVAQGQSIRWKDCRDYLEQRNAIAVNRMQAEQAITTEIDLMKVMSTLPQGTDKIVAYALKALKHIKNVRENLLLSQEQQKILRIFEKQHKQYSLAA